MTTEAEELLKAGAMYKKRVGLLAREEGAQLILVGVKSGGFAIYQGEEPMDHFDPDGRWHRTFRVGRHHVRNPDGSAIAVDRPRESGHWTIARSHLDPTEVTELDEAVRVDAVRLSDDLRSDRLELIPPTGKGEMLEKSELLVLLDRVAGWDQAAWGEDARQYHKAYPAGLRRGLLAPDLANAILLDLDDSPTRTHFQAHSEAVAAWLRGRIPALKTIGLRGNRLIREEVEEIISLIDEAKSLFSKGSGPEKSIHFDISQYSEESRRSPENWLKLRNAGVRRIHARMEFKDLFRLAKELEATGIAWEGILFESNAEEISKLPARKGDRILITNGDVSALRNSLGEWLRLHQATISALPQEETS